MCQNLVCFLEETLHLLIPCEAVHMVVSCLHLLCGMLLQKNLSLCLGDVAQTTFSKEMEKVQINSSLKEFNLPHQGACCRNLYRCLVVKILRSHTSCGNMNFSSLSAVALQKPLTKARLHMFFIRSRKVLLSVQTSYCWMRRLSVCEFRSSLQ